MTDNAVLLGIISIVSIIVGTLSYISKRNVDTKYEAQRQQHERDMAELSGRQSGETNLSAALLAIAKSMQAQVDVQAESNRLAASERAAASEQAKAFTTTARLSAEAELALSAAVEVHTSTLAAIQAEAAKQFLANAQVVVTAKKEAVDELTMVITDSDEALGERFDTLKASVETALERMEHGVTNWQEVKVLLERVNAHLDRQQHEARNDAQVAVLTDAVKKRTGETPIVPPENGGETLAS